MLDRCICNIYRYVGFIFVILNENVNYIMYCVEKLFKLSNGSY